MEMLYMVMKINWIDPELYDLDYDPPVVTELCW